MSNCKIVYNKTEKKTQKESLTNTAGHILTTATSTANIQYMYDQKCRARI